MPLYDYRCEEGHVTERLTSRDHEAIYCPCGKPAFRQSVYATASPRRWASEISLPSGVRAALDEATGYKREALAAKAEAVANGFKG